MPSDIRNLTKKKSIMQLKYVLVVPNDISDEDVTPFQGWNPAIRDPKFLTLLSLLSTLPAASQEIFMEQSELINFRTSGVLRNVTSIGSSLLNKLDFGTIDEIVIFLALDREISLIKKTQLTDDKKAILLSFSDEDRVINISRRERDGYRFIDEEILSLLPASSTPYPVLRNTYDAKVSFPKNHGINAPNLSLLQALGYQVEQQHDSEPNLDFGEAERLVVDSANITLNCINEKNQLDREILIYAPSVKVFFYDFKHNIWNQILRKVKEKWKRKLIEACFRNPGYSESRIEFDAPPSDPYSDPILGPILHFRQSELYATTLSIAVMASNEGLVSVRLPNSVNLLGGRLRNLETLAKRSDKKSFMLLQKEFGKYNIDLKAAIGPSIAELVQSSSLACKLCTDIPLEWVYLDKLPLMISHEVSKIPMTPGNTQLQYASMGQRIGIRESDCKKILVVRSFNKDDPLSGVLEDCLQQFDLQDRLKITFTDVQSGEAACEALNSFDGSIVVFDCHGDHGGHSEHGWLQLGNEKVNTWELAYRARIPPIILLSACSTSAIGGSHISVANGLMRSGARSVLGTFLPVNGPRSAIFIARILARLDTYLPAIKKMGYKGITWRTFINTAMKMSYLTDVLVYFKYDLNLIDDATFTQIEIDSLPIISIGRQDWYDLAIATISAACGISKKDLVDKIQSNHPLMETMRYCQVGLPEHISIILEDESAVETSQSKNI